jgi:hypothetical protein
MKKTIILVIASRGDIYDQFIFKYWIPFINYIKDSGKKDIEIFLIFGTNVYTKDFDEIKENILKFDCDENGSFGSWTPGILQKTIKGMEFIDSNYEYDYIFRTNLSSFLIFDNFIKIVESLENNKVYCGVINDYYIKKYISGAGIFISKDLVKYLINNENKLQYNIVDDVAIGYLLQTFIQNPLHRVDICINYFNENTAYNYINEIINNNHYHVRIKNSDRNLDIMYIDFLTNYFYKRFDYIN